MRKLRGFVFHPIGQNSLEIKLTRECIRNIAQSGDNEAACRHWVHCLRPRLDGIEPDTLRAVLRTYGAWDAEELRDNEMNRVRVLWIAAWQCFEEQTCWAHFDGYDD